MIDARGPLFSSGLLAGSNTKRIWLVVSPKLCVSAHCCAHARTSYGTWAEETPQYTVFPIHTGLTKSMRHPVIPASITGSDMYACCFAQHYLHCNRHA